MRWRQVPAALLLLALPAWLGAWSLRELERYQLAVTPWAASAEPVFVDIPAGSSGAEAVRRLAEGGVVCSRAVTLELLQASGRGRELKAGEYRFERPLRPGEVLGRLLEGSVFLRRLTVPEGLSRFEVAARFEREGLGRAEDFLAASAGEAAALIADLDPVARDLEGYLFPETYYLGRRDGAAALVRQMVERFRQAVGPDARQRAEGLGLDLRQVVTLASLVEKETARPEERGLVAGVYFARLRRGMLLQADPTVIYGLMLTGRFDGNLRRAHLREPGPYNTYVNPGLPPGPIASPGRGSLEAALAPADTDYLYFVSRNDGTHVFSRTLGEHNRRVQTFQRDYWREVWRRTRGGQPRPGG